MKKLTKIHLSPYLYAHGGKTLCGNIEHGDSIADFDATSLQEGESFCKECLEKRKSMKQKGTAPGSSGWG